MYSPVSKHLENINAVRTATPSAQNAENNNALKVAMHYWAETLQHSESGVRGSHSEFARNTPNWMFTHDEKRRYVAVREAAETLSLHCAAVSGIGHGSPAYTSAVNHWAQISRERDSLVNLIQERAIGREQL